LVLYRFVGGASPAVCGTAGAGLRQSLIEETGFDKLGHDIMKKEMPELTVVMATYNRCETIKTTLQCLADQDLEPDRYEVIVVDDGSPDATQAVVEDLVDKVPFSLSYLRHQNRGPGYTQNRGIRQARGRILMLMADDIWMEPQTLRHHLEYHLRNPGEHLALLGSVFQSPNLNQTVYLRNWDPHQFGRLKSGIELPYYMFWACNVSLKLDFMKAHGMFRDPKGRAGAAAHEDPELGYRLMRAGMRLYLDIEARGAHYHLEDFEITLDRMYQRGLNFGQFRQLVAQPEVSVAYHVLNRWTLKDHFVTYTTGRTRYLGMREKNPLRMAWHYLLRNLVFNRLTVPGFWLPFLRASERSPLLEKFVRPTFFHGVMAYYFQRGAADGNRIYDGEERNEVKAA
jgi:glycosyltransferase involved in cell wall biosynthesis